MSLRQPASRELVPAPTVAAVFECVSRLSYPILFESTTAGDADAADGTARYSFVAAAPRAVVRSWGMRVEVEDREGRTTVQQGRALDVARTVARIGHVTGDEHQQDREELPPFWGGLAGYIGYEYGRVLERVLEQVNSPPDDVGLADVVLGVYDWTVAWDHRRGRAWVIGASESEVDRVEALINTSGTIVRSEITGISSVSQESHKGHQDSTINVTSTFTRPAYETAVERVREYIRAGDIFQTNLSQRFSISEQITPWSLYCRLKESNPAPFSAYFDFKTAVIVSASPERFLRLEANRRVETRPIKGTRPRGTTPADDAQLAQELLGSAKDASEHVMIVDVLRNDIARVVRIWQRASAVAHGARALCHRAPPRIEHHRTVAHQCRRH